MMLIKIFFVLEPHQQEEAIFDRLQESSGKILIEPSDSCICLYNHAEGPFPYIKRLVVSVSGVSSLIMTLALGILIFITNVFASTHQILQTAFGPRISSSAILRRQQDKGVKEIF